LSEFCFLTIFLFLQEKEKLHTNHVVDNGWMGEMVMMMIIIIAFRDVL
jgi:hypothetical protein